MKKRTPETILEDDKDKIEIGDPVETGEALEEPEVVEEPKGPTPEELVAELTKKLEESNKKTAEETRRREEAEERAAKANTSAGTAVQAHISAQEQAIEGRIGSAKTSLEAIKQQLKQAKVSGDSDAEVDLQDALTNARYELNSAEWEKKQFSTWKEQQIAKNKAQENASPYTGREQAWIASHPEFNTNKKFSRLAKVAAGEALEEGHAQDSKGYFDYIENALRESGLIPDQNEVQEKKVSTATALAPTRSGSPGEGGIVNKGSKYPYIPSNFRIPPEWVQTSQDLGFDDPREYANERLRDKYESANA